MILQRCEGEVGMRIGSIYHDSLASLAIFG